MLDILGKRYYFFLLSLLIIVPGLIVLAIHGLPLAVDFKGGSLLEVQFSSTTLPSTEDIVRLYEANGINEVYVQRTSLVQGQPDDSLIIRSPFMDDTTRSAIVENIKTQFNEPNLAITRFESVGPSIATAVAQRASLAVAVAALAVIIYITLAFRGVPHAFRYGICAIVAMIHDILVVISLTAIGGQIFGWQVDSLYLTALLTVIGFSTQDKIVVFDRIRENSAFLRKLPFEKLANHSIVQTLQRSINTQLMTVEFMLLALALFGGITLREFAVILLVGLFSGTYSSIFIAAPLLVIWENKEWRTWFRRQTPKTA
jgi:preprotein translocase subunit SecF